MGASHTNLYPTRFFVTSGRFAFLDPKREVEFLLINGPVPRPSTTLAKIFEDENSIPVLAEIYLITCIPVQNEQPLALPAQCLQALARLEYSQLCFRKNAYHSLSVGFSYVCKMAKHMVRLMTCYIDTRQHL